MRLDENRTVTDLGNGRHQLTIQRGQNYFDRDAQAYVETPTDLLADDRSAGFSHVHKGQSWKRVGKGGRHRVGFGVGQDVTYSPIGVREVTPVVDGRTATYADLWAGVDVILTVTPEGIKEDLVAKPGAGNSFAWDATLRGVVLDPSGEYVEPLTGKCVGRLLPPTAEYADGVRPCEMTIAGTRITITAEPGWRRIDPTTTIQPDGTAGIDTYLDSVSPTTNYGSATQLYTYGTRRAMHQFSLAGIPVGAVIPAASLQIYANTCAAGNVITANPLTQAWNEAQATWNNRITDTAWTSAGGTYTASYPATATTPISGWVTWNVLSMVQAWFAGTIPNYGLLLRQTTGSDVIGFYSSDYTDDPTLRPKLVVTWIIPPTPSSPIGTQLAPGKVYDTVTPRLSWTVDPAITPTHYQAQVCDVADNLKTDSGDVTSGNKYHDVPAGAGLVYGVTYKWRLKISDGSWTDYTAWQYIICLPSAPTDFIATANIEHARVDLTWTTNSTAAGYNLYRRADGATAWGLVNLSLISGTACPANLIPLAKQNFTGWTAGGGATVTPTQGQVVAEWGATDATRIQTSGGTSIIKTYVSLGTSVSGQPYAASIWVKNQGAAQVRILLQSGNAAYVQPGQAVQVQLTGTGDGVADLQLQIRAGATGDSIDIIAWRPIVVAAAEITHWNDGSGLYGAYSDDTAACGQAYEYTIASVASNGYEGEDDGTEHVTLTFTGAWIADSQVHIPAGSPPNISRPRRASRRVDIRGKHVVQDWGYGERILTLVMRYDSQAELDALLALFPTDTAVSYRDDLGRTFRGKVADDLTDAPFDVWRVIGNLTVILTEVTP
jgi:hypothetical protein